MLENNWSWENMKKASTWWYSQLEKGGTDCGLLYHDQINQLLQMSQKPILCSSHLDIEQSDKYLIIHRQTFGITLCRNRWPVSISEHVKVGKRQMRALSPCKTDSQAVFMQLFPFIWRSRGLVSLTRWTISNYLLILHITIKTSFDGAFFFFFLLHISLVKTPRTKAPPSGKV